MSAQVGPGVLCVGRLYCDLVFGDLPHMPRLGHEVYAGALSLHAGGGAAITAAHLAALGRPVELVAYWRAAPFDAPVKRDMAAAGVGNHLCAPSPTEDPQITVAISAEQDRAFLTRRVGAAAPSLAAVDIAGMGVGHLHIGELATLIEQPELIAQARTAGLTLSLDCSWDDATPRAAADLIAGVDVFFPNAQEVAQLRALGIAEPFAPLTVLKQGSDGATAFGNNAPLFAPAQPVPVVDTTGAGDAFNAGFLHRWLAGADLMACLAAGNAQGARAVQQRGGFAVV